MIRDTLTDARESYHCGPSGNISGSFDGTLGGRYGTCKPKLLSMTSMGLKLYISQLNVIKTDRLNPIFSVINPCPFFKARPTNNPLLLVLLSWKTLVQPNVNNKWGGHAQTYDIKLTQHTYNAQLLFKYRTEFWSKHILRVQSCNGRSKVLKFCGMCAQIRSFKWHATYLCIDIVQEGLLNDFASPFQGLLAFFCGNNWVGICHAQFYPCIL